MRVLGVSNPLTLDRDVKLASDLETELVKR